MIEKRGQRMMKRGLVTLGVLPVIFALLISGCSQSGDSSESQGELQGTITVSGAWALYPMMIRWAEEFQELHPGVEFDISAGGAGKGMADAVTGAVDIGMVSREIYVEEIEKGAFWVSVTKDAVFCTVNDRNPVGEDLRQQGISRETLMGIYITGEITTWGQVVGRPEVTDPIHAYTRSDACGAAATWAAYLGKNQEDLLGVGVYGDPGVLEAVVKDPLGIGFNNLNYVFDFETGEPVTGAHAMSLDLNGNGQVDPDEAFDTKAQAINAVAEGRYPSPPARDLNLVTKGKPDGLVDSFVRWVLSDGQVYVPEVGYIPLAKEQLTAELKKLD